MPANQRQQTAQIPASPTSKATAKYTNKDGSKFIKVPKNFPTSDSSETSPAMAQTTMKPNGQGTVRPADTNGASPTVNRKKQKRRQKQAAKLAAEQPAVAPATNGNRVHGTATRQTQELESQFGEHNLDEDGDFDEHGQFDPPEGEYYSDEDGDGYSGSYGQDGSSNNGYAMPAPNSSSKKSKKKKSKGNQDNSTHGNGGTNGVTHNHPPQSHSQPPPSQSTSGMVRGPGISKEKIWNTSSQEERERIKEFWLSLGEDERKSLVKVEKDAVLKKMKEQQKHSCSCTVCGRKRTAIEEELEVLYDAYYEELEQYANNQGGDGPPPMMPPPRRFGPMSGLQPPHRLPPTFNSQQPSRGRIIEHVGEDEDDDDEGDEEEYSEDDADEDDYSDEEPEELPRSHATDFFNFGNSLTVQGGILTVADDLLKNDGKKFIEMMEQLAERRMAREEDQKEQYANPNYGHAPNGMPHHHHGHHHHPPPPEDDEDEYDDDDEDEYDSQDEDYDEEEMDTMTEEQRMEEGRRMFQIFAARMFEQRVLTAYKEKVAKREAAKLLEELEEESRADSLKKAKKAKDAQKKKDKIAQKKQALAEEKAKREAEKAAEEAAQRAAEEKKAEEQRAKAEEKRKKKEALKKAEEEERLRKEAEKQRRLQEQRERQAEQERKQREAKEREKREKEEQRQKEREAKDAKEREARERKERLEKEKKEKDAKAKADLQAKEQQKRDEKAAAPTATTKRAQPVPVPIPTTLQSHPIAVASPQVPIALPVVPKAPTPIKIRTTSQQDTSGSTTAPQTPQVANKSQNNSPSSSTPLQGGSPGLGPIGPPSKASSQHPFLHHPQATSPIHSALKAPPGMPSPFSSLQPMGMNAFQPGMPMMSPGFGGQMHHQPMFPHQQPLGHQFRPLSGPNGMPMYPGLNQHPMPQGRGFPMQHPPPGFPQQMPNGPVSGLAQAFGMQKDVPAQSHSRHPSGSFEKPFDAAPSTPQAQPIARPRVRQAPGQRNPALPPPPGPIGRPSSVVHEQNHRQPEDQHRGENDIDELSNHLGSSALLDDSDEPLIRSGARRSSAAPMTMNRGFDMTPVGPAAPFGMGSPLGSYGTWGGPPTPFGTSSLPGSSFMGGWGPPTNNAFGPMNGPSAVRHSPPRSVAVRMMICHACEILAGSTSDDFFDIDAIKDKVEFLKPAHEAPVSEQELLDICETEGTPTNGGGNFEIRKDANGHFSIHHDPHGLSFQRTIGEIGSPIVGGGGISRFGAGPPGF